MTIRSRSVRIYMADGTPLGIRQVEVSNRTIQAFAVTRSRLSELKEWNDANRAGVYFLLARPTLEELGQAYIGEAQRVLDRLSDHVRNKDREFWAEVVMFVTKDPNINQKYLEARLIEMARQTNRYSMDQNVQRVPELSRAERDAMEEMLPDIRLVLGALGHPLLEPLTPSSVRVGLQPEGGNVPLIQREFSFTGPSFSAKGRITDEGFVILDGSTAARHTGAITAGYRELRDRLVAEKIIEVADDKQFKFVRDFLTTSSSQAASIVAGGNRSGPGSWKSGGKFLYELESEAVSQ